MKVRTRNKPAKSNDIMNKIGGLVLFFCIFAAVLPIITICLYLIISKKLFTALIISSIMFLGIKHKNYILKCIQSFISKISSFPKEKNTFKITSTDFSKAFKNNIKNHHNYSKNHQTNKSFKKYLWEKICKPLMLKESGIYTGIIFLYIAFFIFSLEKLHISDAIINILGIIGVFLIFFYFLSFPYTHIKYKRKINSNKNNYYHIARNNKDFLYAVEENKSGGIDYYLI